MKNIQKIKKPKNKNFLGFSLIEMLIAMFIFVVAITAAISVFASIASNRQKGQEIQRNVENTRVALDLMAKNMRMSSKLEGKDGIPGGISPAQKFKSVIMFNNSQGVCIGYRFKTDGDDSYLEMGQAFADDKGDCDINKITNFEKIIDGDVSGFFSIVKTESGPNPRVGRATIILMVDTVNLETTVSFRDYDYSN